MTPEEQLALIRGIPDGKNVILFVGSHFHAPFMSTQAMPIEAVSQLTTVGNMNTKDLHVAPTSSTEQIEVPDEIQVTAESTDNQDTIRAPTSQADRSSTNATPYHDSHLADSSIPDRADPPVVIQQADVFPFLAPNDPEQPIVSQTGLSVSSPEVAESTAEPARVVEQSGGENGERARVWTNKQISALIMEHQKTLEKLSIFHPVTRSLQMLLKAMGLDYESATSSIVHQVKAHILTRFPWKGIHENAVRDAHRALFILDMKVKKQKERRSRPVRTLEKAAEQPTIEQVAEAEISQPANSKRVGCPIVTIVEEISIVEAENVCGNGGYGSEKRKRGRLSYEKFIEIPSKKVK